MTKTALDKKIARLEAELKNAKASKTKEARKERNNQLMAFGIMLERSYKEISESHRKSIRYWAINTLEDKNDALLSRVIKGLNRMDSEFPPSEEDTELCDFAVPKFFNGNGQPGEMLDDGSFCSNGEFNELGFRIEK